jgi:prepilin-type N-terminal cleavage/methylation domain-containing protein
MEKESIMDIKKNLDQKGFTLIELMIAMAILAVGILAILSMHVASIRGNASAVKYTESHLATQSQIESFIMAGYASISNAGASTADGYTEVTSAELDTIPPGYTLEYIVNTETDLDLDGTSDLKEINVRVKDASGTTRSDITFTKERG